MKRNAPTRTTLAQDDTQTLEPSEPTSEVIRLNTSSSYFDIIGYGLDSKIMGPASTSALFKWLTLHTPGEPQPSHPPWQDELPSEEYRVPSDVDPSLIALPPPNELRLALDAYFSKLLLKSSFHLLFPIIDEQSLRQAAQAAHHDPIFKAMLFVVCSLGFAARDRDMSVSPQADQMLMAAWHMLPSLLSRPYRAAVQTLTLMGLAMRYKNKDGVCMMLVGFAIRIAHSLGGHLHRPGPHASIDSRIWFSLYSLDKIAAFEAGRPSLIRDSDCSVPLEIGQSERTFIVDGVAFDFLGIMTRLGRTVSRISSSLFAQGVLSLSVEETLQRIGEADRALQTFAESEQRELMLGPEAIPTANILPLVMPIFALYHLAVITVHRLSLLNHEQLVAPFLDKPLVRPYADRLRSSKSLCLTSARLMLSALEQVRFAPWPRFWTFHPFFASCLTLMIGVWQEPKSWQAKADLQILEQVAQFSSSLYQDCGFPVSFTGVLPRLAQITKGIVSGQLSPNMHLKATDNRSGDDNKAGPTKSSKSKSEKAAQSLPERFDADGQDGEDDCEDDLPEVDILGWQAMLQDVLGDGAALFQEQEQTTNIGVEEDLRQLFASV
ncbi:hypothetical protein OIV83_005848 [Microbotryomycetes sp. JL201]|nr:hypothetical protein OIV83_005848 [Microbotryomycetes sp. JL201]